MADLHLQRCLNHPTREAAARCPGCRQFFCRECTTEHEGRLLCAACLRKRAGRPLLQRAGLRWVLRAGGAFAGLAVGWLFFHWIAQGLMAIPADLHEGTVWVGSTWEEP
jgi:hypothetical protein